MQYFCYSIIIENQPETYELVEEAEYVGEEEESRGTHSNKISNSLEFSLNENMASKQNFTSS